jgi:hypothetical protein
MRVHILRVRSSELQESGCQIRPGVRRGLVRSGMFISVRTPTAELEAEAGSHVAGPGLGKPATAEQSGVGAQGVHDQCPGIEGTDERVLYEREPVRLRRCDAGVHVVGDHVIDDCVSLVGRIGYA